MNKKFLRKKTLINNLSAAIRRIPNRTSIKISADVGLSVHVSSTKDKGTNVTGTDVEKGPDVSIQFSEVSMD